MQVRKLLTTTVRGHRRPTHIAKAALVLTGALSLLGVNSAIASASSAPTLKSLESTLTTMENAYPSGAQLTEAGSSAFYPLMAEWQGHGLASGLSTAAGGSGKGQSGAETGTLDIGASDVYLPQSTLTADGVVNVPVDISSQLVFYNIPGLAHSVHLKLSGTILNNIYNGQITMWNDPAIEAANKGVTIPATKIVALHRTDSSGDTFVFTQYLNAQDPSGIASAGPTQLLNFPNIPNALGESGNGGMQSGCEATPGCIAYIAIGYLRGSINSGLGYAALLNGDKRYILPNTGSINAEVSAFKHLLPNGAESLIDSPSAPAGYPIVFFEYAIVKQNNPKAAAVKGFLAWAMDPRAGSAPSYLDLVSFRPLPVPALSVAVNILKSIS